MKFQDIVTIKNGITDFVWVGNESISKLNGVVMDGDYISLYTIQIKIENNYVSAEEIAIKRICERLNYIRGIFSNDNYLYWFSYNDSDFISGYSKEQIYYNTDISNIHLNINSTNPFEFINNISIKYIEFVNKTQYAYYEIEEGNNTYHGIIDIKKNVILFNTNETIKNIRFFSTNSLLIITEKSAFKLCLFAKDNNECIDSCPTNTELILDTEKSNYCGNKIGKYCDHYILKPNDICVPSCDGNIFYIESNYTCGLCKDLFSDRIYKYNNKNKCYEKSQIILFI